MQPFGVVLILVGAFCAAAAAFDWDFVFNGRKVRSYVALLGRGTMRAIYFFLGVGLVVLGALTALGVIGRQE
jgi:uncharacterized membrane protein YidH (DUF202 family)